MFSRRHFKIKPVHAIVLAAALYAGAGAQAAITVFTSQTNFLNMVQAPGDDSFDDLLLQPYANTLTRHAGAYGYTAYSGGGLWGAGGTGGDYWLSNNYSHNPIVFAGFGSGVWGFGGDFFPTDVGGAASIGNVVLSAVDGTALTYNLSDATPGSFLGFVSDAPLSSVTLGTDGGDYWPSANNVVLAVPEPASYGMLLAGLGLAGAAARRRA